MVIRFGFGIFTGQSRQGGTVSSEYRTGLDLAPVIEGSGFESFWVSEHHGATDGYLPSCLTFLAAVAARTERLTMGSAVILAPLHNPIRLAEDAAVVDLISGGRLILGLGAGWRPEEFRSLDADLTTRGSFVENVVPALRLAWTGDRFSYSGGPIQIDQVQVRPAPEREIPIWLGGIARPALLRAGRIGDGFIATSPDPQSLAERLAMVDEGAQSVGLPGIPRVGIMLDAWLGKVDDEARRAFWSARAVYDGWRDGQDSPGKPYAPGSAPTTAVPPFAGDATALAEQIAELAAVAGKDRDVTLITRLHYPGIALERTRAVVEEFGALVVPEVRRLLT